MLVLSGMYLYKTYAAFTEEKHFNVINGTVQDPGDIYFAYYVDNTITRSMPKKGTGYTLDTEKSNCTNGVIPKWDNSGWQFIGDYSGYNATDYTRTRCDLYFKKIDITAIDYIKELAKYDTETLATDEAGGNIRYIGKDPDNYVNVDGDIFRIIGVMKDIDNGTGKKESRIKLISASSIGNYSWDSSESSINNGCGVNEWSQADLMKLLNPGYESESVGGSLYWNSKSGNCYNEKNNMSTNCNFTSSGMKESLKELIDNAVWNTGAANDMKYKTTKFYELERSENTGKICTSGDYCNDAIERTTKWTGKVGLMYLSDYGYATSGDANSTKYTRDFCLLQTFDSYGDNESCIINNWFFSMGSDQYTMTPRYQSSGANSVLMIDDIGYAFNSLSYKSFAIRPVVYLKTTIKIISGDGSSSNPYVLSGS